MKISVGRIATVREELVKMQDGVKLYTRIITPNRGKSFPIIYIRTPYAKSINEVPLNLEEYENDPFINAGYAIVFQHCRGTGDSEGFCIPYENEREDGLCTLEYIRTLDFYNGEIYLKGGSYLSSVHLLYLADKPSDIKGALLEIQTDRMYFRNYKNGCNYNFCNAEWFFGMSKRRYPTQDFSQINKRPYLDIAHRVLGEDYPELTEMLLNCEYNDYWKNDSRTDVIDAINFPVLFVDGWYDFYIDGMFSMWERLSDKNKKRSAFIVGPWGHDVKVNKNFDYPNLNNGNLPSDYALEWFNSIRENREYKYADLNKVNYYSVGADRWQKGVYSNNCDNPEILHFDKLNSNCKSNVLNYVYDPDAKIDLFKESGLYIADGVDKLCGVTSFYTDTFSEESSYFGKIGCHLTVSSDCEDTAFYVHFSFIEDGISYPLTEVITSLSAFYPYYTPGSVAILDINTPPIAFTIKPGGAIRIDVSSTGGKYVPHANVRGHWAKITEAKIANNTVYLDKSYVELPCMKN